MSNAEHRERVTDLKGVIAEATGDQKTLAREALRAERLRARLDRLERLLERTTDKAAKERLLREQKRRQAELAFRSLKVEELREAMTGEVAEAEAE